MPGTAVYVPVRRAAAESRDLDEVRDLLARRYVDHRPQIIGGAREFLFRSRAVWAGGLTLEKALYRAGMAIHADPLPTILVVNVVSGAFGAGAGRRRARAAAGESLLCLPRTALDVTIDRLLYRVVQLPGDAPARVAGRFGVALDDFRFEGMAPLSPAANRYWQKTVGYLAHLLADPGPAGIPALLLTAAIDTAAAAALSVFPNTTLTIDYLAGPGGAGPAVIRRAVSYIESHATEPITLEDIAAATGLGARAVQMAFRRHLDTTPLGYLRRVRLEQAHRDLQAADPTTGATVAGIARRWGFTSAGRFAGHYRAAFGRAPSRTLRA